MRRTSKKIIFIAGLHGNEQYPLLALTGSGLPVIAGNLKALKRSVRYIDQDLNKSFGLGSKTYEAKRANELLNIIPEKSLVIDLHTTSAITEPFVIVIDRKMIPFAATSGLKHIVYMKYNIKKGRALINFRNGFSVETGNNNDEKSMLVSLSVVKNVQCGKRRKNIHIYEVFGIVKEPGNYINFQKHKNGFIPVLAGETSYDFFGLKAKEVTKDYQLK